MPRLHQTERLLLSEIRQAAPSAYRKYFEGWVKAKPPCFRERGHAWLVMSDVLDEADLLPLARLMRTMPALMPTLARQANHDRYLRRYHPDVLTRGGYYQPTPATEAYTNIDRAKLELFDLLLTRPMLMTVYAFIPAERSSRRPRDHTSGHRAFEQHQEAVSYKSGTVGTWTGSPLGTCDTGKAWRDNLGGGRVPIDVTMKNGCRYYGHYYFTAGDYCRLKMVKADVDRVIANDWSFPAWLNDTNDSGPIPLPGVGATD